MVGAGFNWSIMQSTPFISSSYAFDSWVLISWDRCGRCAGLAFLSDFWMSLWHVFRCCVVAFRWLIAGLCVDAIWCAWARVSLGWCLGGTGGCGAFSLNIYQVLSGFVVSVSGGRETGIEVRIL